MDVLTDVLNTLRLKSSVYYRSDIAKHDWSLRFNATPGAMFHVLQKGHCIAQVDGGGSVVLHEGDVLVLTQGHRHILSDRVDLVPMIAIQLDQDYPVFHRQQYGDGDPTTTLICGVFDFEHQHRFPLLASMPAVLHIPHEHSQRAGLDATLNLIARESALQRAGTTTLIKRLSDVLFIQVVRLWMEDPTTIARGWLKALQDPAIGHTLSLIHAAPEADWTVEKLARSVAMSRSGFAARFSELVGETPFQYLTRWRMQTAITLMADSRLSLQAVALRVGYDSEGAFHRAFKRHIGMNPGQHRRRVGGGA